jgi:hypothetical protein
MNSIDQMESITLGCSKEKNKPRKGYEILDLLYN